MSKKKIATITYHSAINVGATLQAYALQKHLESTGVSTAIIDYRNKHVTKSNRAFSMKRLTLTNLAKAALAYPMRLLLNRRFGKFLGSMTLTKPVQADADFAALNERYDAFIVGSDQVWNPHHGGGVEERFFLNFVNDDEKKYSYAASFGFSEMPVELIEDYASELSRFKSISVREGTAVDMVKQLTGVIPVRSLDPVFLLEPEVWRALAIEPKKGKKYMLLFLVNGLNDILVQRARTIASERGLELVCLSNTMRAVFGARVVRGAGPREFLGYIIGADAVFTDSFHGTAFSILFNKKFQVGIVEQFGNKNNRSIELMELMDIPASGTLDTGSDFNWDYVNDIIKRERDISTQYLEAVASGVDK